MHIQVAGRPLTEGYQLEEWSSTMQGSEAMEWTVKPGLPDPRLRPGQLVELFDGPACVWVGRLGQPDRAAGRMKATGLAELAYSTPSLNSGGAVTTVANTAVDAAITRGALPWIRDASLSAANVSTDTQGETPTIGEILDAAADDVGKWWRIGNDRRVEFYSKPTTPQWVTTPAAGALGVAEGDYASVLQGRRRDVTAGTYATETVSDAEALALLGRVEATVDLTALGYLTAAKAQSILAGRLAKGRARYKWTNGISVSPFTLRSPGGVPAHMTSVFGGDLVRFMVQRDESRYLRGRGYVDELIGRIEHRPTQGVVELQPANLDEGIDLRDAVAGVGSAVSATRKQRRRRAS